MLTSTISSGSSLNSTNGNLGSEVAALIADRIVASPRGYIGSGNPMQPLKVFSPRRDLLSVTNTPRGSLSAAGEPSGIDVTLRSLR